MVEKDYMKFTDYLTLFTIIIGSVIFGASITVGIYSNQPNSVGECNFVVGETNKTYVPKQFSYKNHEYLVFQPYLTGVKNEQGITVVHDPDCSCHILKINNSFNKN